MAFAKVEEMGGDPGVLGRHSSVENRAEDIFNMLDVDNDGALTMEEFVDGYLRYFMHMNYKSVCQACQPSIQDPCVSKCSCESGKEARKFGDRGQERLG